MPNRRHFADTGIARTYFKMESGPQFIAVADEHVKEEDSLIQLLIHVIKEFCRKKDSTINKGRLIRFLKALMRHLGITEEDLKE